MNLSHRITSITSGGSDGWEVYYRARKLADEGHDITELTVGEHDIRTAPAILREMYDAAVAGQTGYSPIPGTDALRDQIAARIHERTGVTTRRDNIVVTPGGQAGLFATHHAVLDDGDRALFIDPYYATYPGTIRAVGGTPVPVQARPENGFQPTTADIAAKADGAKSLLVNSPNNPTGAVYSHETLSSMSTLCKERDLWLISDEVYDTQVWDGTHLSPRSLPDMQARTLVIGSMSKSHAMTGSRIGWVCGPVDAVDSIADLALTTTFGVPGFIQQAALFALQQGAALEEEIAAPFRRRREITDRLLAAQNVVHTAPIQGAMYAMLDIRATGLSGIAFADQLLDRHSIAVMPGESFGAAAAGHLRVAMTVEDSRYRSALGKLLNFAAELASP